jgi:hypothetical protein
MSIHHSKRTRLLANKSALWLVLMIVVKLIDGCRVKTHCRVRQILGSTLDWPAEALHLSGPMLRLWRIVVIIVGFLMLCRPRH